MTRTLCIAVLAVAGLAGCVTDGYQYRGGSGDYYYGRPSVDYYHYGYGSPYSNIGYGYPGGWSGRFGYRYGYGYPYYGGYGYPYYYRPPYYHRPRPPRHPPPHPPAQDETHVTGGNLPAERVTDGGPQGAMRLPRAAVEPRPSPGRAPWRNPGGLRTRGNEARVDAPRVIAAPQPPRAVAPVPRVESRPRMSGDGPRARIQRSAVRERDTGQELVP